jgi:hypothetical protein
MLDVTFLDVPTATQCRYAMHNPGLVPDFNTKFADQFKAALNDSVENETNQINFTLNEEVGDQYLHMMDVVAGLNDPNQKAAEIGRLCADGIEILLGIKQYMEVKKGFANIIFQVGFDDEQWTATQKVALTFSFSCTF